jgi:transposase
VAGCERKVMFAVNTLGYSRRFHFVAMECADAEHTYESLILSLEYFGGVPDEVLVDNQKAEVISHRVGIAVEFNQRFLELAAHYDFRPRACKPRRPRTKGKDERMVRYIKENFFVRYREFESLTHLNQLAEQWLRQEADQRLHGTVKEVVAERFARQVAALESAAGDARRHCVPRTPVGGLGRIQRGARQPLQRPGRAVRGAGRSADRARRHAGDL